MMRFTRTLQKRVTKTGPHYVLSIPREVAQDLQLEAGGLCSIAVKVTPRGRAEVALKAYQDDPLFVRHFNIEGLGVYDAPLTISCPLEEPVTKGPSQPVNRQLFKPFLAASRLAIRMLRIRMNQMMATPSGRAALAIAFRKRGFR